MKIAKDVEALINDAVVFASQMRHEYVTPEHVWYILADRPGFRRAFSNCKGDADKLKEQLKEYLDELDEVPETEEQKKELGRRCTAGGDQAFQGQDLSQEKQGLGNQDTANPGDNGDGRYRIGISASFNQMLEEAARKAFSAERDILGMGHLIYSMMELEESYGAYFVKLQGVSCVDLLVELEIAAPNGAASGTAKPDAPASGEAPFEGNGDEAPGRERILLKYAVCMNDEVEHHLPFIGREKELERTMQVLCRCQKNNPLHVGEPGVGKTAIAYGLAARINQGRVPKKLKNARIYGIDLGSMLAGSQFRGDFEKRLKAVMEELREEENPILYIDEIHNLVGAGAVGEGSMDASNLLKPYLADGHIRFIGATTYEEYKKYFSKDKSLTRRFQNIDIKEPSLDETVDILKGLQAYYEKYHCVRYQKGIMEYAAELAHRYMNERYLPDKAIDLIDEAGAYLELHPKDKKIQVVDKKLIEEVLSKITNVPSQTVEAGERRKLASLDKELKSRVFGQDQAVDQLTGVIKLNRAGLNEDNKPMASLLFVGPTGVGKTELARSAAEVLGVRLIRFDMSEYAEKHTVAKLIGSPAGYVGYEEGGLLTEAVRKNPHCVLLLDEIEKAHPDIYNVLLQVMDYAVLTDNQGRKADFSNVLLIMTSNAGADKADRAAIGFGGRELNEDAISDEVKRVFRPEFRNRLDRIIIFRPLNRPMAEKIVKKQLALLAEKTGKRQVKLTMTRPCFDYLAGKGLSREYGAREIVRLINQEVKPLLVDELLFGRLKKGGNCSVDYDGEKVLLKIKAPAQA